MQARQDPPRNPRGQPYGVFHHPLRDFAHDRSIHDEDSLTLNSIARGQRLPPRSRTGCWTCRRRKVKCDEARPVCAQCARLQQTCDYGPRITFRDDTPRICSRMRGVSVDGCPVWSQHISSRAYAPNYMDRLDDMPTFASLSNDEEREQKAALYPPGTYSVVALPQTLASLPEYSENEGNLRQTDFEVSSLQIGDESVRRRGGASASLDDTTVILDRFEMPMMQTIYQPEPQANQQARRQQQKPHQQHERRQELKHEDDEGQTPDSSVSGVTPLALPAHSAPYPVPITPQFDQIAPQTFDTTFNFQSDIPASFPYDPQHHHHQHHQHHHNYHHRQQQPQQHYHAPLPHPPLPLASQSRQQQQQHQQQPQPPIFHSSPQHGQPYLVAGYPQPTSVNVHPPLHRLHTHPGITMQSPISPDGPGYYRRPSMPLSAGSSSVLGRLSGISSPFPSDQWDEEEGV